MTTRVVFMGSPEFSVPALESLIGARDFEVVGVVTQPDRPAGRGGHLKAQPVKVAAEAAAIPVYQPARLRGNDALEYLAVWKADVHVVAAYGQILKPEFLDLPPHGSINVHASLLPRWRGAAPIQAAIRAGDSETGITIMKMDAGLDTGPMLLSEAIPIGSQDTGQSLHDKLSQLGGEVLLLALRRYLAGDLPARPQSDEEATYAPQLKKDDGRIDWTQTAAEIDRHVRAYYPWPGTFTTWGGQAMKIISGAVVQGALQPGLVQHGSGDSPIIIGTGKDLYAPSVLQLASKKALSASAFLNGHDDIVGSTLE